MILGPEMLTEMEPIEAEASTSAECATHAKALFEEVFIVIWHVKLPKSAVSLLRVYWHQKFIY